jgi:hypothetical protein
MCSIGCCTGPSKIGGLKKFYIVVVLVNRECKNDCFAVFCKAQTLFSKAMFGLVVCNGMGWNKIVFHCLDITKMNGMEWNMMVSIPPYSIVYSHFASPPIWEVWNGME